MFDDQTDETWCSMQRQKVVEYITGDLPTDYYSASEIEPPQHPRNAVRVIANRWLKQVEECQSGKDFAGISIAGPQSQHELAPLLKSRAELLLQWADNHSMWDAE